MEKQTIRNLNLELDDKLQYVATVHMETKSLFCIQKLSLTRISIPFPYRTHFHGEYFIIKNLKKFYLLLMIGIRVWYWIIYRGPGFPVAVWFGSSPTPSLHSPVSKLDHRHKGRLRKRNNLLMGVGKGGGGWGAKSFGRKKARSSINYLILSDTPSLFTCNLM